MGSSLDAATVGEILTAISACKPNAAQYLVKRFKVIEEQTAISRTASLPQAPNKVQECLIPIERACRRLLDFLDLQKDTTPFDEMTPALSAFHNFRFQLAAAISSKRPEKLFADGTMDAVVNGHANSLSQLLTGLRASQRSLQGGIKSPAWRDDCPSTDVIQEAETPSAEAPFLKRARDDIRHRGDEELDGAVVLLLDLYEQLTNKRPSVTVRGPAVRFLRLLLPCLGWTDKTDNAIRHLIRKNINT